MLAARSRFRAPAPFGLEGDPSHHAHGLQRILPRGCLAREHHRVAAVEDRICHVARFRPGWPGAGDHALQHLRGGNRGQTEGDGALENRFLDHRHPLGGDLHAQVTARDHDGVAGAQHGIERGYRLRLLELRDDGRIRAECPQLVFREHHILGAADKGKRDVVHAHLHAITQVREVLLREGGGADMDAGQVDPLPLFEQPATDHLALGVRIGGVKHKQLERTIVEEQRVAGLGIVREMLIRRGHKLRRARHITARKGHTLPSDERHRMLQLANSDLRSLKVLQDGDRGVEPRRQPVDEAGGLGVFLRLAVGEVKAEHIHPGLHQRPQS